jgi:LCP family protein required for cell wall assembly
MSGRHRGGSSGGGTGRHVARRAVQMIAAACSVIIFAAFGYGWYSYNSLTRNQHTVAFGGLGEPTPTAGASGSATTHVDGSAQNILIVGVDSRAGLTSAQERYYHVGQSDQSTSTDTIIIVHVPANGAKATLVSIPRDTYVNIPGYQPGKINAAFADGYYNSGATTPEAQQKAGGTELIETVKKLTGLPLDHYVQVGFSGFVNIVKAIGKVPIDLCEAVNDTYTHNRANGISGGSGFKMSAGKHKLDPQQALEFVRQRHNIPGPVTDDLGRELRQRYFLRAAFQKIESADVLLNPIKLNHLISAIDGAFTFDNRNFGIEQFALQMSDLTAGNIVGKSIPTTGDATIGGQDVLSVDPVAVQKFVQKFFYPSTSSKAPTKHKTTRSPGTSSSSTAAKTGDKGCVY